MIDDIENLAKDKLFFDEYISKIMELMKVFDIK